MFGHSPADALGQNVELIIPERFHPGHQARCRMPHRTA